MKPDQVSSDAKINQAKEGDGGQSILHCQWISQLYTKPSSEISPAVFVSSVVWWTIPPPPMLPSAVAALAIGALVSGDGTCST